MLRRMNRRLLVSALVLATLASCNEPKRERKQIGPPGAEITTPDRPKSAPATSGSTIAALPSATASATGTAKGSAASSAPAVPLEPGDICRVTRGPMQVPFTGQALLWIDEASPEREVRVVFNHDGVPRAASLPAAAKPAPPAKNGKRGDTKRAPERLALSEPAERLVLPPCAFAGGSFFCVDKSGAIHRSRTLGEEGAVVAQARSGSPVAAASIGGSHVVYAFLADRKTTEGAVTLAFAGFDDQTPITLSEDGAGATFVTLAPRGEEVVAMYIDARRVLTPVHARVLTGGSGKLSRGPDAVLFVGSGTDARTAGVIAQGGPGSELVLLALEKDEKEFGMAAVQLDEQPRDDARVTWSIYPAGIDHGQIAATQGSTPMRVLRVRPASAEPKAKKVLELGELSGGGVYKPSCPVAEGSKFVDPAILVDRQGAVWLAYTDGDGTWIERRGR
ncbi:Hypothetical protein A7982_10033 [Minicystis rosea]|nr:Hypothetical protein A7982_10033 [Minicystis rosea]